MPRFVVTRPRRRPHPVAFPYGRRDATPIANADEDFPPFVAGPVTTFPAASSFPDVEPSVWRWLAYAEPLALAEDRRRWEPQGGPQDVHRVARRISGRPARVIAPPARKTRSTRPKFASSPPAALVFRAPARVAVCVRRRTRREVIFARGQAGRPGRPSRPPRRSVYSSIHC